METFFLNLSIFASTFFPVFFIITAILWRLRSYGLVTLLLPLVFDAGLMLIGYTFAPRIMHYHPVCSMGGPLEIGIMMGIHPPTVYFFMYHFNALKNIPGRKDS